MLEILVLIALTGLVGKVAQEKGHPGGQYKVLTVVLWFGGEILGALVGAAIAGSSSDSQCALYLVALMGAAAGGITAYVIVNNLSPVGQFSEAVPASGSGSGVPLPLTVEDRIAAGVCPKCGKAVGSADQNCPSCRINLAWARQNAHQLAA